MRRGVDDRCVTLQGFAVRATSLALSLHNQRDCQQCVLLIDDDLDGDQCTRVESSSSLVGGWLVKVQR
jgi:hypothetical protein